LACPALRPKRSALRAGSPGFAPGKANDHNSKQKKKGGIFNEL